MNAIMQNFISHIPILTTIFALVFALEVLRRYRTKGKGTHLLWWAAGMLMYGAGTFAEGFVTLFGWNETIFRWWYITGALLGGMPLAQGTVYLLMKRKLADRLTFTVVPIILIAAACVLLSPIDFALVEPYRLSGKVLQWQWVRLFSPFINTYAFVFLVGGAILSAYRFHKNHNTRHRFIGNVYIALGALLPGIGGTFTRFGYTEVLYVTELLGIVLIYVGYRFCIRTPLAAQTRTQHTAAFAEQHA
ncbi:hypothetical protein HUU05_29845 [candidate division KSB1 bacterium]|nr:hypothetical protein [candidate division KSB1 bacterium]